jgi:hypothetical protein
MLSDLPRSYIWNTDWESVAANEGKNSHSSAFNSDATAFASSVLPKLSST